MIKWNGSTFEELPSLEIMMRGQEVNSIIRNRRPQLMAPKKRSRCVYRVDSGKGILFDRGRTEPDRDMFRRMGGQEIQQLLQSSSKSA
jgi:hypothetical protein